MTSLREHCARITRALRGKTLHVCDSPLFKANDINPSGYNKYPLFDKSITFAELVRQQGNIYRPPRSLNENYNEFVNEFSTVRSISSLKNNQKQNLILAGDYNINMLKINEHEHCSNFFDMLTSFSLFPQITFPTRFSDRKGTLIDNFFLYTD